MLKEIREMIENVLDKDDYIKDEPLKNHCFFKIGGKTPYLITVKSVQKLQTIIDLLNRFNQNFFVMGNGSNLLISDEGIDLPVIKLGNDFSKVRVEDENIIVQGGALLSSVSKRAQKEGLTGLEFASGIPGSVGGAIAMNAGAYGGEMKDIFEEALCLTNEGKIRKLNNQQMKFSYRNSIVLNEDMIVLEIKLRLKRGNKNKIKAKMDEYDKLRISKQPVNLPSAGSTFKRPEGFYTGQLVESCGLKGLRFGDAQVSAKHCGFIVNVGNASANEVKTLIQVIQKTVLDIHNVRLETEIRMIGF